MNEFPKRLQALRKGLRLTQSQLAEQMGLSMSYIHQLEAGKRTPSDSVETLVRMFESQLNAGMIGDPVTEMHKGTVMREDVAHYKTTHRMIPVIGWAHAGSAESYEEIPAGWQHRIPTECHDVKAFAVSLEGDSMEPRFQEGDVLIVQPSEVPYSGCFVVAKFMNDGIVFRRLEMQGDRITLVPLNDRYPASTHGVEEFTWIYPVWGRWTQIWKR